MLKLLRINNIALIPSLELELGAGLTLLTGETGAGKSILIDALGLVLGDRASPDLIRIGRGAGRRSRRSSRSEAPQALLDERGLPGDGDEVVLRRELQASGKGRATVNGALVPVGLLRDLAPHLAVDPRPARAAGPARPGGAPRARRPLRGRATPARPIGRALPRRARGRGGARAAARGPARGRAPPRDARVPGGRDRAGGARGRRGGGAAHARRRATPTPAASPSLSGEAFALLYDDEAAALTRLGQVFKRVEELAAIDAEFRPFLEAQADVPAAARGPRALPARLPRAARGEPRPARRDRVAAGARRAAQEEVRRQRRGGAGVRRRAAARSSRRCGSPEEQEQAARGAPGAARPRPTSSGPRRSRSGAARRPATSSSGCRPSSRELAMEKTRFEVLLHAGRPRGRARPVGLDRARARAGRVPAVAEPGRGAAAAGADRLGRRAVAHHAGPQVGRAAPTRRARRSCSTRSTRASAGAWPRSWAASCKAIADTQQVLCVTHLPQIAAFADAAPRRAQAGRRAAAPRPTSTRCPRPTASRKWRGCWGARRSRDAARATPARCSSRAFAREADLMETKAKKRFFIQTFGCQMNVNDSEKVAGLLEARGLRAGRGGRTTPTSCSSTPARCARRPRRSFHSRWCGSAH